MRPTDIATSSERISAWARKWAFPALLCAVAVQQLLAVATLGLTPWKGGGVGMFSSVDMPSARILRVEALVDGHSVRLDLSSTQDDPWTERASWFALGQLTENNLRRLVGRLAMLDWIPVGMEGPLLAAEKMPESESGTVAPDLSNVTVLRLRSAQDRWLPASATIHLDRVRAQIWRRQFDPSSRELTFIPASPVVEESSAQ